MVDVVKASTIRYPSSGRFDVERQPAPMKISFLTLGLSALLVSAAGAVGFPSTVSDGVGLTFNTLCLPISTCSSRPAASSFERMCIGRRLSLFRDNTTFLLPTFSTPRVRRGIHRSMTLCYGNGLYGTDPTTQTWRDGFTNFAAAAAAHYVGQDDIYEIWNEPNGGYSTPNLSDVSTYMALVKSVVPAMRAADPTCKILGPSLSDLTSTNINWLKSCIDQGLLNYVDAISVHPYRSTNPENGGGRLHVHSQSNDGSRKNRAAGVYRVGLLHGYYDGHC